MNSQAALRLLVSLGAGALFGVGLSLSGMVDPSRVLGFLDVGSGNWNPSLMFVLGGAVAVTIPGVLLQRRRARPAFEDRFYLPGRQATINGRLVVGSAIFGIGWGLAGFCPGPAVAGLSIGLIPIVVFVVAMAGGMIVHDRFVAVKST